MLNRHAHAALLAALLAAVLATGAGPAAADDDAMHIGGFAGYHLFNENNELGQDDVPEASSLEHSLVYGIRVSHRIIDVVTGEGELAFAPTRVRGTDDRIDVIQFGWRGHAMLHPARPLAGRLLPFALFGAGGSTAASNETRILRNDTDFVVHAGVGARLRIGEDWGARLDVRLALPPSSESESVTAEGEFMIGLYRSFGRARKPAPPPEAAPAAAAAAPRGGPLGG